MRLLVEVEEEALDRLPELLADRALDILERERPHVVLQARSSLMMSGGTMSGPGREQLAELHERRAELVEQLAQMVAARRDALGAADIAASGAVPFDHVAEAVPDRDLGDLAQATEVPLLLAGFGHPRSLGQMPERDPGDRCRVDASECP